MTSAVHHVHKRKRIHHKKEVFPHPHKWVNFLDNFLLFIAVLGPVVVIPQIVKVYLHQEVTGLSIWTWGLLTIGAVPWVLYGLVHKEKPIIISYGLWFLAYLSIVIGILLYG